MSRRHHGRSRHANARVDEFPRAPAQLEPRPDAANEPRPAPNASAALDGPHPAEPLAVAGPGAGEAPNGAPSNGFAGGGAHVNGAPAIGAPVPGGDPNGLGRSGCTAPQLRRFIKSRPYVPMHELRRRFGINGAEDEVSALPIDRASVYVGLPERECRLLGELVRGGEVGYELSLDPRTPIVVGVYPMRPVPRA